MGRIPQKPKARVASIRRDLKTFLNFGFKIILQRARIPVLEGRQCPDSNPRSCSDRRAGAPRTHSPSSITSILRKCESASAFFGAVNATSPPKDEYLPSRGYELRAWFGDSDKPTNCLCPPAGAGSESPSVIPT